MFARSFVAPVGTAALLALVALPAAAQDAPPKPREFSTDVGFVNTSGNAKVTTFNLQELLILRAGRWEHRQKFGSIYGSIDGKESTNIVFANWRSDIAINKVFAVYGLGAFDRNPFSGISRRFEESAGLAAKLLQHSTDHWDVELGLSLNQQRSTDDIQTNFSSLRSATMYKHDFSKAAYFLQSLEFLPSFKVSEDYRINSESAIVAPLSTHVAMKAGYVVRFDNLPEPGKQKSDRIFTTGLQFNW